MAKSRKTTVRCLLRLTTVIFYLKIPTKNEVSAADLEFSDNQQFFSNSQPASNSSSTSSSSFSECHWLVVFESGPYQIFPTASIYLVWQISSSTDLSSLPDLLSHPVWPRHLCWQKSWCLGKHHGCWWYFIGTSPIWTVPRLQLPPVFHPVLIFRRRTWVGGKMSRRSWGRSLILPLPGPSPPATQTVGSWWQASPGSSDWWILAWT